MSLPCVVAVAPGSAAARAGVEVGDEVVALNGEVPRDLIEWRLLVDEPELTVDLRRGGLELSTDVVKAAGEPLGVEVDSALFDQVRTCDNHCEFCFIYQLPPGLRRSLYLKDDDYRLSFLYGNFTTLTRFTEADLERVVTEGLSPLYVSIHATDPEVRSQMLRNRRGATSLRWLRALLDHGVKVHGQLVVCPGVNDGGVLDDTLLGVLDRYPELASICVVPLGVSRYNTEERMRPHTPASVDCPDDLDAEVDATTRCIAADEAGNQLGVTVTVTDVDGRDVHLNFQADDELMPGSPDLEGAAPAEGTEAPADAGSVAAQEVERQTTDQLAQITGQRPADVDCPGDLEAEVGASMRCVVTASDGTQIGATLTVTSVDGTTANWDIVVDDAPME
jgi:hypothetical protein